MGQLLFFAGNLVAIFGAFMALFWVMTNKRRYWTRRRRGIIALVFIGAGVFMMVSASNMGGGGSNSSPSPNPSASTPGGR